MRLGFRFLVYEIYTHAISFLQLKTFRPLAVGRVRTGAPLVPLSDAVFILSIIYALQFCILEPGLVVEVALDMRDTFTNDTIF